VRKRRIEENEAITKDLAFVSITNLSCDTGLSSGGVIMFLVGLSPAFVAFDSLRAFLIDFIDLFLVELFLELNIVSFA